MQKKKKKKTIYTSNEGTSNDRRGGWGSNKNEEQVEGWELIHRAFTRAPSLRAGKNFCPEVKRPTGDLGPGSGHGTVDRTGQARTGFQWGPWEAPCLKMFFALKSLGREVFLRPTKPACSIFSRRHSGHTLSWQLPQMGKNHTVCSWEEKPGELLEVTVADKV